MNRGRHYLIGEINHTTREATATLAKLKYTTSPIDHTVVETDGGNLLCPVHLPGEVGLVHHGNAEVIKQVSMLETSRS